MLRAPLIIAVINACALQEANANPISDILDGLAALRARLTGGQPPYNPSTGGSSWQGDQTESTGGGGGFLPGLTGGEPRYTYTTIFPRPPPTTTAPLTAEEWYKTTTMPDPPSTIKIEGTPDDLDTMPEVEVLKTAPWTAPDQVNAPCTQRFTAPNAPLHATDLNGVTLPDVCFESLPEPHHIFAVGDWGGVLHESGWIQPADHRSKLFGPHHRPFILSVDDMAQKNVAAQMAARAAYSNPDYILNVGDNFYWGGVDVKCGAPAFKANDASHQWEHVFEEIYKGPGLDSKQWLGVLGNHDYGGWQFTSGWDQAISYTWAYGKVATSTGRWITPAQYYSASVRYSSFKVNYYFVDNNKFDAFAIDDQPGHNMCSRQHNGEIGSTCGQQGPVSVDDCPGWFDRLWNAQQQWLNAALAGADGQWQIIVTHFPPEGSWGSDLWGNLGYTHGIDLIIAGHRHKQSMTYQFSNPLFPTGVLVTGGGGGITSEYTPSSDGVDDQYGFGDLTLTAEEIMVEMLSHSGEIRSTTCITQRLPQQQQPKPFGGLSMCEGKPPKGPHAHHPQKGDPSIAIEPGDEPAPAPAPYPTDVVLG